MVVVKVLMISLLFYYLFVLSENGPLSELLCMVEISPILGDSTGEMCAVKQYGVGLWECIVNG